MRLGLGTVQFGLDYGISNPDGRTPYSDVGSILKMASLNGVQDLDTAPSYGNAEEVLGEQSAGLGEFRIFSKSPLFKGEKIGKNDLLRLESIFRESLSRLKKDSFSGYLIHNVENLASEGGEGLYRSVDGLKKQGLVKKVGVSVYDSAQIDFVLKNFDIDLIQLPLNLFDWRLIKSGHLVKLKKRGVEIHARSIFLQGLLFSAAPLSDTFFSPIKETLCECRRFFEERGLTPLEGAYAFTKSIPEVDMVIIGVNSPWQLEANINAFRKTYDPSLFAMLERFYIRDPKFLNPSLWNLEQA